MKLAGRESRASYGGLAVVQVNIGVNVSVYVIILVK